MNKTFSSLVLGIVAMVVAAPAAMAQTVLIPRGTKISVVLLSTIKSSTSKVGDRVKATTLEESSDIFPEGTMITGTVTDVVQRDKGINGMVKIAFNRATLSNGRRVYLDAELEGIKQASGGDKTKKNAITGAAIGAGAGLILNKNKETGALLGGLLGGAIGASAGNGNNSSDFEVKAGTVLNIVLIKSAKVPDLSAPVEAPAPIKSEVKADDEVLEAKVVPTHPAKVVTPAPKHPASAVKAKAKPVKPKAKHAKKPVHTEQ